MTGFNIFCEESSSGLVICDVQPSAKNYIHFDMREFCKWAMIYPRVVVLYNGPEFGFENAGTIARWYNQNGVPGRVLRSWKWFQKNYAWFRDIIDSGCHHRQHVIKLIRYMVKNKKWDWRDLTEEDFAKLKLPTLTIDMVDEYNFNIPDLAFKIRSLNGYDICGGHVEACLEEVTLLAEALNVQLNVVRKWTY